MIFSFAVLVQGGGPDGIVWQALNPATIFNGGEGVEGAARVFGVGLAGVGFFAAFWSWVGFEMAPNYAEESAEPEEDDGATPSTSPASASASSTRSGRGC